MASISTSLRRTSIEVVRRCWAWAYFGEDPTGIAQDVATLNGEYLLGLKNANNPSGYTPQSVPSECVGMIGVSSGDVVVLPNGVTIPTGKALAITDADGLTVGGVIVPQYLDLTFTLDAAQAVSRAVFIAPAAYQLVGVNFSQGVASSSGTITVEKCTGTTAPGSGTALLTGTVSTAGTANTVLPGTLIATTASLQFAAGNRLGLVFAGTQTNLVGLTATIRLKRI